MAQFVKGDIVLTPFPFSGDEDFKVPPAVVLAVLPYAGGTDYLLCIITTQAAPDPLLLPLDNTDIEGGRLSQSCYLRPGNTYTVAEALIRRRLGHLKPAKFSAVVPVLVAALTQ